MGPRAVKSKRGTSKKPAPKKSKKTPTDEDEVTEEPELFPEEVIPETQPAKTSKVTESLPATVTETSEGQAEHSEEELEPENEEEEEDEEEEEATNPPEEEEVSFHYFIFVEK